MMGGDEAKHKAELDRKYQLIEHFGFLFGLHRNERDDNYLGEGVSILKFKGVGKQVIGLCNDWDEDKIIENFGHALKEFGRRQTSLKIFNILTNKNE